MTGASPSFGVIYVVATPIGNLGDLTPRARETLAKVDLIAAEDTRHTGNLLNALGIHTQLISLHEHNEEHRIAELVARLERGQSIALVSDAGTPLISDPGYRLVNAVVTKGYRAIPIPGPCAAIAALSVSGLSVEKFVFEGFLPAKAAARRTRLRELKAEQRTLVFYEGPHRLVEVLDDMAAELGSRTTVIARELTKAYESVYFGTLDLLAKQAASEPNMARGELVILVEGAAEEQSSVSFDTEQLLRVLLEELPPAAAAKIAAKLTGQRRNELYPLAVQLAGRE